MALFPSCSHPYSEFRTATVRLSERRRRRRHWELPVIEIHQPIRYHLPLKASQNFPFRASFRRSKVTVPTCQDAANTTAWVHRRCPYYVTTVQWYLGLSCVYRTKQPVYKTATTRYASKRYCRFEAKLVRESSARCLICLYD